MSENFFSLKEKLEKIKDTASTVNFRDKKNELFQLKSASHTVGLTYEQKGEILSLFDECFEIVNELLEKDRSEFENESYKNQQILTPKVEEALINAKYAEGDDINPAWDFCIKVQQEFKGIKLIKEARETLYSQLQEAFDILKEKRDKKKIISEEEKVAFEITAKDNVDTVEAMIKEAEDLAQNSENFKETFEQLKNIQQGFKEYKLIHEDREALYMRLQNAFEIIKKRQEDFFNQKNKESIENYTRLKPMVEKALERAQTSMEFKKTKEHLKRVQSEFKGIKMKVEDREELYSKLQTAFDFIHKRQDEYYAAKKDKIELHINYQISDVNLKIEALLAEIEKDNEAMKNLSESENNPLMDDYSLDPSQDINNHIQILKASVARKEKEISELNEMKSSLEKKKDKWDGVE